MSEELIRQEVEKAAGNTEIEGHAITLYEKDLISRIIEQYLGQPTEAAIDQLLEDVITVEPNIERGENKDGNQRALGRSTR